MKAYILYKFDTGNADIITKGDFVRFNLKKNNILAHSNNANELFYVYKLHKEIQEKGSSQPLMNFFNCTVKKYGIDYDVEVDL